MSTSTISVGVNGYGVIGKRVADALGMQPDMRLLGVCDVTCVSGLLRRRQGDVVGRKLTRTRVWSTAVVSPALAWASMALATMGSRARGAYRLHGF